MVLLTFQLSFQHSLADLRYNLGIENNPYVNKLLTEVTKEYNGVDWDIVSRKTYNYDNTAGVNDFNDNQITVYPNPTTDFIYLSNINENLDYKLYDVTGKISMEGKLIANKKIDISNLKSGLFILQLKTETGNITHRKVFKN
ncbi:T9SS type A sorting domain-containing protein [Mariniflexile sp.]|uniref:T9SS type A sorting domain-containing protein n=1 Tax=Mariniflexile sp. TaxID=1979402 RepID=UPI004048A650